MDRIAEEITTAEQFYASLKNVLKRGLVLYVTKGSEGTGGREVTFSGWEANGRLRFHMDDSYNPEGRMRYIRKEDILEVYQVYEPDSPKKLVQQIKKICGYRDIRRSVLKQLMVDYG